MEFQSTNSLSDTTSNIVEPKLDEYFLHDHVRGCESGHDWAFHLEELCVVLGTTDLVALIYEYKRLISRQEFARRRP